MSPANAEPQEHRAETATGTRTAITTPTAEQDAGPLPVPLAGHDDDEKAEVLVDWEGEDDTENPQNWSTAFKSWVTFQLSLLAFSASLASSIIAPASQTIAGYTGVSENVVVLNVSLFM